MNKKLKSSIVRNSSLNMYGTIFYYACQWLTTIIAVWFAGFESTGIYSLAISFTNIFGFISRYGVRTHQISDTSHEHTDGSYITARGFSSAVAILVFFVILFFTNFSVTSLQCVFVLFVFKLLESFSDVFFGVFQKINHYNAIAISFTLKGVFPLLLFTVVLWTKEIVIACLAMAITYLSVLLFYDLPVLLRSKNVVWKFSMCSVKKILWICFPLMIFTLVNPYITFITRYSIEQLFSEEVLGYYSSVSTVVVVLSTLGGSIFAVVAPQASTLYQKEDKKGLIRIFVRIIGGIAGVVFIAILSGYFLGKWALALLFGESIVPFSYLLLPTILVSGLLTLVAFFSSMLTAFQKRTPMLLANLAGAAVCTALAWPFAQKFGLLGACWCLATSMGVQAVLLTLLCYKAIRPLQTNNPKEEIDG
jgi:O-antigen/teichoic acid export membrane protein